jgi:hypothetical protein
LFFLVQGEAVLGFGIEGYSRDGYGTLWAGFKGVDRYLEQHRIETIGLQVSQPWTVLNK